VAPHILILRKILSVNVSTDARQTFIKWLLCPCDSYTNVEIKLCVCPNVFLFFFKISFFQGWKTFKEVIKFFSRSGGSLYIILTQQILIRKNTVLVILLLNYSQFYTVHTIFGT